MDGPDHTGNLRAVATVCIGPNDNMEVRRGEIAEAIQRVDEGRGVVMLTDLFGGGQLTRMGTYTVPIPRLTNIVVSPLRASPEATGNFCAASAPTPGSTT